MSWQKLFILRHGQTVWNAITSKIHQTHSNGQGNILTEAGIKQAKIAAEVLRDETIDLAFHTPLTRARQTLEIISSLHSETKRIIEDPRITEMSMSFLDGMTQAEWETEFPFLKILYAARKKDKFGCLLPEGDYSHCLEKARKISLQNGETDKIIPGWENYSDVIKRITPFINDLDIFEAPSILISGHQGLNRALLGVILNGTQYLPEISVITDLNTPNAAIFKIERLKGTLKLFHNLGNGWKEGFIE